MKAIQALLDFLRKFLPSPFTLAVILTVVAFLAAAVKISVGIVVETPVGEGIDLGKLPDEVSKHWYGGFSGSGLLAFALQMMLMLVLGHVLALTKPVKALVNLTLPLIKDSATAALVVTLATVAMGLFNWGLALIFGAVLARKVGEYASENGIKLNYALIGAAGYSGLMVWHGGLSGSAPLKVAEAGHQFEQICGVVGMEQTVFSSMNLVVSLVLLVLLPLGMYLMARITPAEVPVFPNSGKGDTDGGGNQQAAQESEYTPAEQLDGWGVLSKLFGGMILLVVLWVAIGAPLYAGKSLSLSFLNPNYINFFLLGLCLLLHDHFRAFLGGVQEAIKGASGILIQFPLYGGIMGLLSGSGIIQDVSNLFVFISNETTFPLFTLLSAGIVNFFVPSGGGQWMVQGPIVLEASQTLGVPYWKGIMALSYGDQLTNMMQPFWALPLLGITGLKAGDIIPYTLFLMGIGVLIFASGLLLF